ncbi:alpha/beta fold hydrolase [Pseudonocardia sp. GCM10023141]|uniref:alpha/beta fold hydrolase n=1 Tax=Pseudonocardia sp. GCM10023141 TaxID=3252653 RepID=UPI003612D466
MTTSSVTRTNPDTVVSTEGNHVAFQRFGDGPPIIVLPGAMNPGESWRGVAERLADTYTVLLVDRRGYPPSEEAGGVSSFAREVADVRALIAHVGGSAHVLGHSYGGLLALHAALADPSGIRSLLLYEAPVLAGGPHVAAALPRFRELLAAGDPFAAIMVFLTEVVRVTPADMALMATDDPESDPEPEDIAAMARPVLHDFESVSGLTTDMNDFAPITLPVLLMAGSTTFGNSLAGSTEALQAVLPQAEVVVWEGQSHFANMMAPETVAATLRGYLEGR